jgi:hypothetical protein
MFIDGEFARVRTELSAQLGVDRETYRERINRAIGVLTRLAVAVDYTRLEGGNYARWLRGRTRPRRVAVKSHTTPAFRRRFAELPAHIQAQARAACRQFLRDPN